MTAAPYVSLAMVADAAVAKRSERAASARQPEAADVPTRLPDELLPVEHFPIKALPEALRPRVEDVAERMNCPPEFVALPMLVAAGMLAARKVSIKPQGLTDCGERWSAGPAR